MGASCGGKKEAQSSQSCVTPLAAVQQGNTRIAASTKAPRSGIPVLSGQKSALP